MGSKDEMEITSTYFEPENNTNESILEFQKIYQQAICIVEKISELDTEINELLNNCDDEKTKELEVCRLTKQKAELKNEYIKTAQRLADLVKSPNVDLNSLECPKLDTDHHNNVNNEPEDHECEGLASVIVVDDFNNPKLFHYEQRNNTCIDNDESFCSCTDESEDACNDFIEKPATENCNGLSKKLDLDHEKEVIRDELMATMGEVKLLHQQNRDLLSQLNTSNQRTAFLSNVLRNMPYHTECQENEKSRDTSKNTETESSSQDLMNEVERLRNELNEMKRDRCQIELARKILNTSDSQYANCWKSTNQNDSDQIKLEELTEKLNRVLVERDIKSEEITDLRKKLDATIYEFKKNEDCLVISKTRICQLESELFELKSARLHDTGIVRSNDKRLIENLKHRLFEAKAEINNMQMVLDFHLTELEDKKAKNMEVLQINHEQKNRIETLYKEKSKIAKEYEDEFKRMDAHLKTCLEEIGSLPAKLASVQRELEKERATRTVIEEERNTLLNDIKSLKASLPLENNAEKDNIIKDLEEQKTQLTATVMNLKDDLKENKRLYIERTHYAFQLNEQLNVVREEAAIQVTKIKDFFECQKLKYTEYIQQLEKQLAESRAIACSEFKKRDHVDERLRNRIEILTKNLNEANIKIEEIAKVNKLIENNSREDFCKGPKKSGSMCYK